MLRKAFVLVAPIAVVAGLALMPATASADLVCPKGATSVQYCEKVCVVPQLRGQNILIGYLLLLIHNCSLGRLTLSAQKSVSVFAIISTDPPAAALKPAGFPVNVVVRLTAAKDEAVHTGKHPHKAKKKPRRNTDKKRK